MKRLVLLLLSIPALIVAIEKTTYARRNRTNGSIVVAGQTRKYLLYVPRSYDSSRHTPLVISLHGAGGWPAQQRDVTHWNRLADAEGFIVVYPSGADKRGPRTWSERDVPFLSALIDEVQAGYNIDAERVYANGLSNGAEMSFILSCRLSSRIAAVGLVGAARMLPWTWCTDRRGVPMIAFHGTADSMAPYTGGTSWVSTSRPFLDVQTSVARWARRNRCAPQPVDTRVAADVTRRTYTNCADDAAVVLYTVHGGGHTWPGGEPLPEWFVGTTSNGVDATREMWRFFRERRLTTPASPPS